MTKVEIIREYELTEQEIRAGLAELVQRGSVRGRYPADPFNLFPANSELDFSKFKENDFSMKISSSERAIMEMFHLVPGAIGFEEGLSIMENLAALRWEMVKRLLAAYRSIKAKRHFVYMAKKHEHSWISDLDPSKVDFGKGKRMIVPNSKYDRKHLIRVPRDSHEGISQ